MPLTSCCPPNSCAATYSDPLLSICQGLDFGMEKDASGHDLSRPPGVLQRTTVAGRKVGDSSLYLFAILAPMK